MAKEIPADFHALYYRGKEVFNSDVRAAVSANNEVISVAGQLFPGAAAVRNRVRAAATTSAEEAIAKAASALTSVDYETADFSPTAAPPNSAPYRFYELTPKAGDPRPRFERPVRVKDVMFPLGEGQFVSGYYMELWVKDFPAFSYVIDAIDAPDMLFRKNLTSRAAFKYRGHNAGDALCRPEDGPAPGTPHPTGIPDGFQAPTVPEKFIEIDSLLPGDPWLPPNEETTRGNNCIAYADLRRPDGLGRGDVIGRVTSARVFDYGYNHSKPASDAINLQNSLVMTLKRVSSP